MQTGVEAFMRTMAEFGFGPMLEDELVLYKLAAVGGAHPGTSLPTGVGVQELQPWPQAPPHWLHFPADLKFARTNSRPSPKSGWLMHSRQITGWGDAPPGVAWASHVRAVLSETVA